MENTCVNVAYISDTKYKIITTVTKMFQKHSVSVVYTHTHTHTHTHIYIYFFLYIVFTFTYLPCILLLSNFFVF